ncbi:MAG: hypothetical protein H6Q31_1314 [Bacteroidetes bacterium]|nr:hypothetical protein [Bacteroidota bacterium]
MRSWRILMIASGMMLALAVCAAAQQEPKKVLVVAEGKTDITSFAIGDGRQLATLLGHFRTSTTVIGVEDYVPGSLGRYDYVFYVGFHARNVVPRRFLDDVLKATVPVVWIHTGFAEFSASHNTARVYGFSVDHIDSTSGFHTVEHGPDRFTKEEPNLNIVAIAKPAQVEVIATAYAEKTKRRVPYIVRSGNLLYIADCPFASATPADRYILFADLLHDILGEEHEVSHSAIIRIEDVNPMEDPDRLRDVADVLSERGIPFLVGVSPFYVNPGEGLRVSLSDKPEIVDALKYMVRNGGTIVMHGVTHQYKGVTGADFEFWDESTNRPIVGESEEAIRRKLEMGIQEFMKNGLYPLLWETPHYTASFLLYTVIGDYFSTAMEQRLSIEHADYSQFFPYVIRRDLFGQMLYPENLGYVPLLPSTDSSRVYVLEMIRNARANLTVRDGFAAGFFHAFVDLSLLKELVDSVQAMGYTYIDVREGVHRVQTRDRAILTGSQEFSVTLADQYLVETVTDRNGEIVRRTVSETRLTGKTVRNVDLEPGEVYRAEPTEFKERQQSTLEKVVYHVKRTVGELVSDDETWREARPLILWNQYARGAAYNDQASFAAVFASISIPVDTVFIGQPIPLSPYNLVIVPFGFVDSMKLEQYDALVQWVKNGGALITDSRNYLIEEFGVRFGMTGLKVDRAMDRLFPEEQITWRTPELVTRFEIDDVDEVFCVDNATEAPLVVGKTFGNGKVLYVATRFDPHTQLGYSHYPFFMEYVRTYLRFAPVLRREALEMYFDPGFRNNQSIEQLIRLWVQRGIRRIHVAGWHTYPKYTYDYKRLLTLAHANGILVYAWLEPPQVSQKFWLEHPEWREKNFRGEDVRPSWRYPVALTDARCASALTEEYVTFLRQYDWDGVNLAELYFEAGNGFRDSALYTPMHASAREEVRKLYGIDLPRIFDSRSPVYWKTHPEVREMITSYRVRKLEYLYRRLLHAFSEVEKTRDGFEVIVTAMDSYGSPELRENIGVDMQTVVDLQKELGFTLQVEDPERQWSTDPMRYVAMGRQYEALLGSSEHLLLDLNILAFREQDVLTPFPTRIQTGTESFHLVRASALGAPRATIYAESSINPQDLPFLASAYAGTVKMTRVGEVYALEAPHHFTLHLPPEVKEISLDGSPLAPMRDNLYLIPAGRHMVKSVSNAGGGLSSHQFNPRLLSITGTLLSVHYEMRSASFSYVSDGRCLVMLDREPHALIVDGHSSSFYTMKGNDGYSVFLPPGQHTVYLEAGDAFSYGVNLTSFWSSTAIALFGLVSVAALLVMYGGVLLRRRLVPTGRKPLP